MSTCYKCGEQWTNENRVETPLLCPTTGTVCWDLKHGEWATHFDNQRGEYGSHLIIGHRTGIRRYGSVRNIGQPPFVGRKPKPKTL